MTQGTLTEGFPAEVAPNDEANLSIEATMTIVEHLDELRRRIIVSLTALVVASIGGWFVSRQVVHFLALRVGQFVFVHPTEAFFSYLQVAVAVGLVVSGPFIVAQAWLFLVPGLWPKEAKFFRTWVPWVVILFIGGMAFAYFTVYPVALRFFMGYGGSTIKTMLPISLYLDFVLSWLLPFGIMFEFPLVMVLLAKLGVINAAFMRRNRKYFLFAAFIVAAVFTPSEVLAQFLMAIPLLALYEISILVVAKVKPVTGLRDEEPPVA
jgi:sec-independent protein translocase protein TatC